MAEVAPIDVRVRLTVQRHQRLGARPVLMVPYELDEGYAAELAEQFAAATGSLTPVILGDGVTVSEWAPPGRYTERRFLAAASVRRRAWWQ